MRFRYPRNLRNVFLFLFFFLCQIKNFPRVRILSTKRWPNTSSYDCRQDKVRASPKIRGFSLLPWCYIVIAPTLSASTASHHTWVKINVLEYDFTGIAVTILLMDDDARRIPVTSNKPDDGIIFKYIEPSIPKCYYNTQHLHETIIIVDQLNIR